jgi:hypothetical protein
MIPVDFGDGQIVHMPQDKLDGPYNKVTDDSHQTTYITEYKFMGRIVHKSVHVQLKHGIGVEGVLGRVGG